MINIDVYAKIGVCIYFGNQNLCNDNIIVTTLMELRNSNRHKHGFQCQHYIPDNYNND